MKIGFIGIGNMGGAILKGFLNGGTNSDDIFVYDTNKEKVLNFKNLYNINVCKDYESLISKIDVLILAVKPDVILHLLSSIKSYISLYKPVIVSIAAGISINKLYKAISNDEIGIVRIMPNINAEINLSTSAYCYENVENHTVDKIVSLFEKVGSVFYIPEAKFSIFSAIAGCAPAYVYLFLDSLAKGAQKMGLNKKDALDIVVDMLIGSGKMLQDNKEHPWELIDKVCSPGGTTIEGICTLEENNFQQSIVKAIENTVVKDRLLNEP